MYAFSAAHRSLPLPSFARVTNLDSGQSVIVRVNDRGPFHEGRLIDLSYAAAVKLGITRRGTGRVEVRALQPDASQPGTVYAAASPPGPQRGIPTGSPTTMATGAPPAAVGAPAVAALDVAVEARKPIASSALDTLVSAIPVVEPSTPAPAAPDYRFDMHQNGRAMSADEFEAWMRTRQVRVATGRAGTPDALPATTNSVPVAASAPVTASDLLPAPAVAAETPSPDAVTLQVASFAARENADRALSMLRQAGIADARLHDGEAAGKVVYRLRVGTDAARIAEMSSRIVGLGFGTPQRVRD